MPSSLKKMAARRRPTQENGRVHPFCNTFRLFMMACWLLIIIFTAQVVLISNMSKNALKYIAAEENTNANPVEVDTKKTSPQQKEEKNEMAHKSSTDTASTAPPIIAYVVSLIKCSSTGSTTGFLDSAAVLRHSIHKNSIHNPLSSSRYSYKMYAIVHSQCAQHAPFFSKLGYTPLVRPPPLVDEEIKGEYLRNRIKHENCCGSAEFVKLYAYTLTDHPITVHFDMDKAVLQPMDDLFDAMLYDKDSLEGRAARKRLQSQELEFPDEPLPDVIDAYFTRDYTSNKPWEKIAGVQGGFLVARPNPSYLDEYLAFIKEGDYRGGRGEGSGWGGEGYGGFQGAMAYQGVVAWFYDHYHPNTAVQLHTCRWNQVVADVIWRGPERMQHKGECRRYPKDGDHSKNTNCEDCRVTPIDQVKTAHYTACKKPWECTVPHPRNPRDKSQVYRLQNLTNITSCMIMHKEWFKLRMDFEDQMKKFVNGMGMEAEIRVRDGGFEKDSFLGYCKNAGHYLSMAPLPDNFDIEKMYGMG